MKLYRCNNDAHKHTVDATTRALSAAMGCVMASHLEDPIKMGVLSKLGEVEFMCEYYYKLLDALRTLYESLNSSPLLLKNVVRRELAWGKVSSLLGACPGGAGLLVALKEELG